MLCGMAVLAELWAHFCLVHAMLDFIHSTISCSLLPGRHIEPFHGHIEPFHGHSSLLHSCINL